MQPKIIVFTGVDGSGKTTHAKLVVDHLQKRGIVVGFAQQFASHRLTRMISRKVAPTLQRMERNASWETFPNNGEKDQRKLSNRSLNTWANIRIIFSGLEHTWSRIISNWSSTIIVFDRYFYDDLIKGKWMFSLSDNIGESLTHLVPQPSALFYLDISAENAFNRETDNDMTLDQLHKKKETYDDWFQRIGSGLRNIHIINTEKEEKWTHLQIIDILDKVLAE
jgi:thymidylate kinase